MTIRKQFNIRRGPRTVSVSLGLSREIASVKKRPISFFQARSFFPFLLSMKHTIRRHDRDLTILRYAASVPLRDLLPEPIPSGSESNAASAASEFYSLTVTPAEVSIVQPTSWAVKDGAEKFENGWIAFEVILPDGQESIDFSERRSASGSVSHLITSKKNRNEGTIGVLADLSKVLKDAGVSLFVTSTFNTDWILVKKESSETVRSLLPLLMTRELYR